VVGVSETCPTCDRTLADLNRKITYNWGGHTAVYCAVCDSPERRKADAPKLEAADIETTRAVQYGWKEESWRVYLKVGDTPGCITFPTQAIMKAVDGNTKPIEWRLENEFNRRVDLEGAGEELAEEWLSEPVEEYSTTGGTVRKGGSRE
jgi:hypothetical protein